MLKLLQKFKELFYGTLGTYKIDPVDSELKEDVNPICSRPSPIPKAHKKVFKKEVENLFLPRFRERSNDINWLKSNKMISKKLSQLWPTMLY